MKLAMREIANGYVEDGHLITKNIYFFKFYVAHYYSKCSNCVIRPSLKQFITQLLAICTFFEHPWHINLTSLEGQKGVKVAIKKFKTYYHQGNKRPKKCELSSQEFPLTSMPF